MGDAARGKLIGMKPGLPRWEPVLGGLPWIRGAWTGVLSTWVAVFFSFPLP